MDKIIEGAKLVEIDKSKKYVLMIDDEISQSVIEGILETWREWLDSQDKPVLVICGTSLKLLEVEKDEQD